MTGLGPWWAAMAGVWWYRATHRRRRPPHGPGGHAPATREPPRCNEGAEGCDIVHGPLGTVEQAPVAGVPPWPVIPPDLHSLWMHPGDYPKGDTSLTSKQGQPPPVDTAIRKLAGIAVVRAWYSAYEWADDPPYLICPDCDTLSPPLANLPAAVAWVTTHDRECPS